MTAELTREERRIRAQQALDAIKNAGWVFDEYAKRKQAEWINSSPDEHGAEHRERIWRAVNCALSIKAELALTIDNWQNEETLREHRDRNSTD
jgi:hypothetical protein